MSGLGHQYNGDGMRKSASVAWDLGASGFDALVSYACRRLKYLAAPRVPLLVRAVIVQPELTRESFSRSERVLYELNEVGHG